MKRLLLLTMCIGRHAVGHTRTHDGRSLSGIGTDAPVASNEFTQEVDGLKPVTTCYWKIVASIPAAIEPQSEVYSFTISR